MIGLSLVDHRVVSALGLGIIDMMAVNVSRPKEQCLSRSLKELVRSGARVTANFLKNVLERPSGPGLLWGLSDLIARRTSSVITGLSMGSRLASDDLGIGKFSFGTIFLPGAAEKMLSLHIARLVSYGTPQAL